MLLYNMGRKAHSVSPIPEVVDLFCGIGGLSYGLKSQGLIIKGGFDLDPTCKYAYEHNIGALFFHKDIKTVTGEEIQSLYSDKSIRILAGCAPCQPFSSYSHKKDKDPNKYDLLYEFGRLVREVSPDYVTMENVSQIINFKLKPVFPDFLQTLVAVWQDFKKEYHDNEPYCNIIIDNRTNVAQIAIEKSGAFGGKEGTDKVKSILEEFINNAVKPYGYQVEITRKLRSIEMWDMVADRIKQHDPVKYVRFNFRDPAETQAIDATEMQLKQLELMSALRKATGAVSSFMQMEASNTGTLILDKEQKDLAGMVGLCSNNGWDIDIHFRDFGIYRTGQLQSAVFPLNIAILNQFASDEGRIEFEGPEGELDLILWLDNIRDITNDYDYNDSTANIRRKGKAKK